MPRKAPDMIIEEISGNQYADLKTAQDAALSLLVINFETVINDLLERGILKNENGKIIPNNSKDKL